MILASSQTWLPTLQLQTDLSFLQDAADECVMLNHASALHMIEEHNVQEMELDCEMSRPSFAWLPVENPVAQCSS